MEAVLGRKPQSLGEVIESILQPVLERARTRRVNKNQAQRNRNTVKKIRNIYKDSEARAAWLDEFSGALQSPDVGEWVEKQSRSSGKTYWFNPKTGESVWVKPVGAAPALAPAAAPAAPAAAPAAPAAAKAAPAAAKAAPAAAKAAPAAAKAAPAPPAAAKPAAAPPAAAKPAAAPPAAAKAAAAPPAAAKPAPAPPAKPAAPPQAAPPPAPGKVPTLYGKSKDQKIKVWSIHVTRDPKDKATINVQYGYQGGALQESVKEITEGKAGRTAFEQAVSEAQSDWRKKKDNGYAENVSDAHAPGVANAAAIGAHETILPMLAHDYHKRGKSIVFPAYVQAKLDGVRSIFHNGTLTSRMGKPFTGLEHIIAELDPATAEGIILDGEVYSDELPFQQFVGLVKKKVYTAADREQLKKVKLWVYDCVVNKPFEQRLAILKDFFSRHKFTHVHLLPTEEAASAAELKALHDKYTAKNYEGLIVRNKQGPYELGTRSIHLQKYKEFEDDEYEIVGAKDGEGKEKGLVIWICKTKDGKTFNVRPKGSEEERAELFRNAANYIGKKLTVRFQELTGDGIPRFPVGLAFRDYE